MEIIFNILPLFIFIFQNLLKLEIRVGMKSPVRLKTTVFFPVLTTNKIP